MKTTIIFTKMSFRNSFMFNDVNNMFEVMPGDIIFSPKPKPKSKTDYSVREV